MRDRKKSKIIFRDRAQKKSGGPFIKNFFYWLIFLAFIGANIYALFFSPFTAVSKIKITGTETIDGEIVSEKIRNVMEGKYLRLIRRDNFIFLPKMKIAEKIKKDLLRVDSVEIVKKFPNEMTVRLKEKSLKLVLCAGEACFVIDDAGLAYAPADFEAGQLGEKNLDILRDDSGKEISQGGAALDSEYVNFILAAKNKIESDLGIEAQKEIHTPNISSGDVRMETIEGWKIFLDKNIPVEKEVEMLRITLNKIDEQKRKDLEYVDLRVNNKVFYKFK